MLQEAVDGACFDNGPPRGRPRHRPGQPAAEVPERTCLKGQAGAASARNLLGKKARGLLRAARSSWRVPYLKLHQWRAAESSWRLELFKPFIHGPSSSSARRRQNIKGRQEDGRLDDPRGVGRPRAGPSTSNPRSCSTAHRRSNPPGHPGRSSRCSSRAKPSRVHPLVCHAFQRGLRRRPDGGPTCRCPPRRRAEARILMLSSNNILSPAHGAAARHADPGHDPRRPTTSRTGPGRRGSLQKGRPAATHEPRAALLPPPQQEAELVLRARAA